MAWCGWIGILGAIYLGGMLLNNVIERITDKIDVVIGEIQSLREDVDTLHHDLINIEIKIGQKNVE